MKFVRTTHIKKLSQVDVSDFGQVPGGDDCDDFNPLLP